MSLQGSLRFNPKDYVRTIFFGLHGSDNNDGLNEDALKREFWAAIATANLVPLGAGERVCVVGLGTGSFDHADPSGTGQITINSGVDVFAPHASIVGTEGTDPQPKLILQGSNTFNVSILSARPAVPSANGLLIERGSSGANTFINIEAFNNISAAAGTGKFNFTGITNAEFFIKIDKINASTQVLSCDAADSFVDLEINQIVAAPLLTTFSFISIEDSEAIIKLDNIRSGGSTGTLTGILASGTANVCVYAFGFEGLDVDYATEDTATMDIFTCMDNGTSDAAGGPINIASPTDGLAEVLLKGNTSGGTNIELTDDDRLILDNATNYINFVSASLDVVSSGDMQLFFNGGLLALSEVASLITIQPNKSSTTFQTSLTNTRTTFNIQGNGAMNARFQATYGNDANAYTRFEQAAANMQILFGSAMTSFLINADNQDVDTIIRGATDNNLIFANAGNDNVGIGQNPNASAKLQVVSTEGGFVAPVMTAAQATAITPISGLMLYVTSTDVTFTSAGYWVYENGVWVKMTNLATIIKSSVATTNATPAEIDKIDTLTAEATHLIEVKATAKSDDDLQWGIWSFVLSVTKLGGTVVVRQTDVISHNSSVGLNSGSVAFTVNGGDIDIDVTGIAATNIQWDCQYEIVLNSTN